jgi:hypothetical protein
MRSAAASQSDPEQSGAPAMSGTTILLSTHRNTPENVSGIGVPPQIDWHVPDACPVVRACLPIKTPRTNVTGKPSGPLLGFHAMQTMIAIQPDANERRGVWATDCALAPQVSCYLPWPENEIPGFISR